jgi:hypothetical protein
MFERLEQRRRIASADATGSPTDPDRHPGNNRRRRRSRPPEHQPPPREELVRGNAMAASPQAYRHARLERLLDDPNLFRRCPAPTSLNRCDDFNSICSIRHRHGCMPHTCQVGDRVRSVRGLSHHLPGRPCSYDACVRDDWADGGWDIDQTIALAKALESRGCAAIHVSSGGLTPSQQIPVGPSYQMPLARAVKKTTRMPVIAVGLITEFEQAEAIVGTRDADLIALARTILYNPRSPWHAAAHFGAHVKAPDQYLRSQPRQYPDLFDICH